MAGSGPWSGFPATQEPGTRRLPDADEVREVLREILAGPEFATLPENPIAALLAWALGELRDLWLWLRELLGDQPGAAAIVTLLIVTAVVVIGVVLARRYAPRWSLTIAWTMPLTSVLPSFVLVCPSNCGCGILTLTTATRPSRMSSPPMLSLRSRARLFRFA